MSHLNNQSPHKSLSLPCDEIDIQDYECTENWNVEKLKSLAYNTKLVRPRTLAWCILLEIFSNNVSKFTQYLTAYRKNYEELRLKFSKDPHSVKDDDPLSQNEESIWNQHFCDKELKSLIQQDVIRTFPDEAYFREKPVQDLMVRVLFTWSRNNMRVGYRQGMHEILAQIIYELKNDRIYAPSSLSQPLDEFLSQEYLEHDSFMIFEAVMQGLRKFYSTGEIPTSSGRIPVFSEIQGTNEVVQYLDELWEESLVPADKELAKHLDKCNISLELFGIRWLRLLFGREFPREEISNLWSYLFADGRTLPNIQHVVVSILVSIREKLLDPDPVSVLSILMRPVNLNVGQVIALAQHFANPSIHPKPPTPSPIPKKQDEESVLDPVLVQFESSSLRINEDKSKTLGGEDVAGELATLALLRAHLPPAVDRLRRALPATLPPNLKEPVTQIIQLTSLMQCRNSLINVETALEAAENINHNIAKKVAPKPNRIKPPKTNHNGKNKEISKVVQMQSFFRTSSCNSDRNGFPNSDPLGLRID